MSSSEDGSSLSDVSSEASSQISDEYSICKDRRKPVVVNRIKVTKCSGPVVVGRKAKIVDVQTRDDNLLDLPSTSTAQASMPPNPSQSDVVDAEIDTEENITQVGENCPGSYCPVINHRQQCGKKEPKWHARPGRGILLNKGGVKFQWSIETFLENPEKFIQDMDINAGSLKEEKEDFILHKMFPHLEESWGKCFSSNEKIYEILAKISCSEKSGKVVRQALQLLLYLICKDNFDSCNQNLLGVEAITRLSILSPDGLFKKDIHSERELKLYVYSRILSSLVIQQVRQGELPIVTLEQDLKKLYDELKKFSRQLSNKKKDGFRYSMEFILKAISYLLKPHDKFNMLKGFLDECQEFCLNQAITSNELKVLCKLKKSGEWIDVHCILIHLHGKVHSERPKPQMETERRAMTLLRLLVETYLAGGGGDDWRFCLLAASILSDIGMNSATKDEEQSRPDPPPLDMHVTYESSDLGNSEDIYSSIPDIYEECNSQSIEEDQETLHYEFYDECSFQFSREMVEGVSVVSEKITRGDVQHLRRLLTLNHPNLASIWKIDNLDSYCPTVDVISKEASLGNLKEYVLDRQCQKEDIVTYLSQVASALHYLHVNHIVHGDLSAEYVNVLAPDKVQVGRLGRSKPLSMSAYEVTSTSCVVKATMPPDSTRWSAPEVILDGHYTHASDVWAFGILAWEMYTSFTAGQDRRESSVPFYDIDNREILPHIRDNGPLTQPDGCPDWMYIIMHQCWTYDSRQRPPFLAIFDCLTSREPMKSWIMTLWLRNHDKSEWPHLSIIQTEDACHVTDTEQHPKKEVIEKMCSEDFFDKHKYKYVDTSSDIAEDVEFGDELYAYSSLPKAGNSEVNENLDSSSEYQAVCISSNEVGEDYLPMTRNAAQGDPDDNESGYLCPVAMEVEERGDIETHSRNENTTDVVGCKRSHTEIYQAEDVSRTLNEATDSQVITNVKKRVVEYKNSAFSLDQYEGSLGFEDEEYQHMAYKLDQHNDPLDKDTGFQEYQNVAYKLGQHNDPQDEDTDFVEYQNIKLDPESLGCSHQNLAYGLSTGEINNTLYSHVNKITNKYQLENKKTVYENINWVPDQTVPQSDQVYANVQEKADEPDCDSTSQVTMETDQAHIEADYQEQETLRHPDQGDDHASDDITGENDAGEHSSISVPSWLNDPQLEITFYV